MQPAIQDREAGRVVAAIFQTTHAFNQDWNHIVAGDRADYAAHGSYPFVGRFQSPRATCVLELSASDPPGTSFHTVVPAPMVAPRPTVTGATSCVSEPICTSSSMMVRCLLTPS